MRGNSSLSSVIAALKDLGGYFVFADEAGEEYVITSKQSFDAAHHGPAETQLSLPPARAIPAPSADDVLEKINRDIALFQMHQDETDVDDLATEPEAAGEPPRELPLPPPRRVRFEPIRGDLPPELQE